jgi:hypothetical protein
MRADNLGTDAAVGRLYVRIFQLANRRIADSFFIIIP